MRTRTLIPFLSLLLAGPATAQEVEPSHEDAPPCLHPELERIAFLEGDWDVVSRQSVDSTADRWEEARAQATWTPILGGCVLQERWSGAQDGAPLEWIQMIAYDHREDTWEQVMIDSAHGNVLKAEGRFDEGRLVFTSPTCATVVCSSTGRRSKRSAPTASTGSWRRRWTEGAPG